jgi:formiminoglutamase
VLQLIKEIVASGKLISADLAKLNPSLDQRGKTAKLAAKLAYEIITDYQSIPLTIYGTST